MKLYLKIVFLLLYVLSSVYIILPYLVSSRKDELLVAALIYAILSPVVVYFTIKSILKENK